MRREAGRGPVVDLELTQPQRRLTLIQPHQKHRGSATGATAKGLNDHGCLEVLAEAVVEVGGGQEDDEPVAVFYGSGYRLDFWKVR